MYINTKKQNTRQGVHFTHVLQVAVLFKLTAVCGMPLGDIHPSNKCILTSHERDVITACQLLIGPSLYCPLKGGVWCMSIRETEYT